MGKRSDGTFERRPNDDYCTPWEAVPPLIPHLRGVRWFAEPCAGKRKLIEHLKSFGLQPTYCNDITWPQPNGGSGDALQFIGTMGCDAIITNPPWSRHLLHPMIERFGSIAPTWLLFDADWAHTRQAAPYLDYCSHIVAVGRLKWIENSPHTGKDNVCWYRFFCQHSGGPRFFGRQQETKQ